MIRSNRIKTKYMLIGVCVLCLLCGALVYPLFTVERPGIEPFTLKGFENRQQDFVITTSWDKDAKCEDYTVIVTKGKKRKLYETKAHCWNIRKVMPGEKYKITIMGRRPGQGMSEAKTMEITAVKEYQTFEIEDDIRAGFKGDTTSVKTKAKGKISYRSLTPDIAGVDESGKVSLKSPGKGQIEITAEGTNLYRKTVQKVDILVFPKKLAPPSNMSIKDTAKNAVTFAWEGVDYADKYQLYKEEYYGSDKYKAAGKETTNCEQSVIRDGGRYKVKALNTVNGLAIESPLSESVEVPPASDDAKAYKEPKTLKMLGKSNTKKLAALPNNGYTLQSMCITKDRYVIVYTSRNGKSGRLYSYTFDGKSKGYVSTGALGHGNGCTYSPATNRIYVAQGCESSRSAKIAVFNAETLKREPDISVEKEPSGIAYDPYNGFHYMKYGSKILVENEDYKILGEIKMKRHRISQDLGAYNGMAIVCVWPGGADAYIDMYRVKDGAYLGGYQTTFGELESVVIKDGKFAFIVNNGSNDGLYVADEPIEF